MINVFVFGPSDLIKWMTALVEVADTLRWLGFREHGVFTQTKKKIYTNVLATKCTFSCEYKKLCTNALTTKSTFC